MNSSSCKSQIQSRRKKFRGAVRRRLPCGGDNRLMKPFLAQLGFKLTGAQTNVLREIRADMGGAHPMRRLLQGDVGSGKTVGGRVHGADGAGKRLQRGADGADGNSGGAAFSEFSQSGLSRWASKWNCKRAAARAANIEHGTSKIEAGEPASSISHPPFSSARTLCSQRGFDLPKLGLVIIDEQHKFGVAQRETLVRKGNYPHLLVMTATPIPRTLGLTLYGDLDVSVIDEMPAGRGRIKTFVRTADKLPKVWEFIREKISAGRQAYVVYPRVEEQDTANDIKAVTKEFENVQRVACAVQGRACCTGG